MLGPDQPGKAVYVNKWVTFSACAICQLSAGLAYTFGMFSADLKERFGWSQGQLTGFGTALNLVRGAPAKIPSLPV
jgi:Nodulin-like